ncbi:MAG: zinc ribbon domain-containing protein [Chloroflexi bacterium]|nr:zinc ribbon domain-containing protein [Chloroflexota bacterium]
MALRLLYTVSALVAAALAALAAVLAWASVKVPLVGTATRYGWEGDGIITMLLALVALPFVANTWLERRPSALRLTALFTAFLGALVFVIALINRLDTERAAGALQSKLGVDLDRLIGINVDNLVRAKEGSYVALAAGVVLAAGSLLTFAVAYLRPSTALAPGDPALTCPRCRAEPPPASRFCPACGARLG